MANKEDSLLIGQLEDQILKCSESYMITNSAFLDLRQHSIAEKLSQTKSGLNYSFYGGYEDAERVMEIFVPEYITEDVKEYFEENPEDNPISVLRVSLKKGSPILSHRDYLGSLMGLGIKREVTGDILVREDGADIIVMKEMVQYIMMNMEKAGRARLNFEEVPVGKLIIPEQNRTESVESVASLRLDNVISAVFNLARSKAADAVSEGIVFVNGVEASKPEKQVSEGDKLVLRGKGKAVFKSIEGHSSKGRVIIRIEKYN